MFWTETNTSSSSRRAATLIQSIWRMFVAKMIAYDYMERRHRAARVRAHASARKIQRWFHGFSVRKLLQGAVHTAVAQATMEKAKRTDASIL